MLLQSVIAASAFRRSPASGGVVDPDAVLYADFVNGVYELGGAVSTLGGILGGTIEPAAFTAQGMNCDFASGNRPKLSAAALALVQPLMAAGFTLVIEEDRSAKYDSLLVLLSDLDGFYTADGYVGLETRGFAYDTNSLNLSSSSSGDPDPPRFVQNGINRYAWTLGRDIGGGSFRFAISINGSPIVADQPKYFSSGSYGNGYKAAQDKAYALADVVPNLEQFLIGHEANYGYYLENAYIRKLIVYPPVTDSVLAEKSAVAAERFLDIRYDSVEETTRTTATASIDVAIPADIANGDKLVAAILHTDATLTPPAGWSLADSSDYDWSGDHGYVSVYTADVAPGGDVEIADAGSATTWTQGASGTMAGAICAVYDQDGGAISVIATATGDGGSPLLDVTPTADNQLLVIAGGFNGCAASPTG